jgi:DoxX-like family
MNTWSQPLARPLPHRLRAAGYWTATACVAAEMGVGGVWDIARLPFVSDVVVHLGAAALLVPRQPLLKEWAYAGAFFAYTGALVSHLAAGYDLGEVALLVPLTGLTVASWALRPASRRGWMSTTAG